MTKPTTMPLSFDDTETESLVRELSPYARYTVERAAETANRLHALEVTVEHLLTALFGDESAGATRLVLHAFADPDTLAGEVLALCPGILVVGSDRSLPFSVLGVRALDSARSAAGTPDAAVSTAHVLAGALAWVDDEARGALVEAGLSTDAFAPADIAGGEPDEGGPFLSRLENDARRSLGAACRTAAAFGRDAIAPAHIVMGCIDIDAGLRETTGLSAPRARLAITGRDADGTPIEARALPLGAELVELLRGAGPRADTTALLGRVLSAGAEELRLLLLQQRITPALHERAGAAFPDPEPPGAR